MRIPTKTELYNSQSTKYLTEFNNRVQNKEVNGIISDILELRDQNKQVLNCEGACDGSCKPCKNRI